MPAGRLLGLPDHNLSPPLCSYTGSFRSTKAWFCHLRLAPSPQMSCRPVSATLGADLGTPKLLLTAAVPGSSSLLLTHKGSSGNTTQVFSHPEQLRSQSTLQSPDPPGGWEPPGPCPLCHPTWPSPHVPEVATRGSPAAEGKAPRGGAAPAWHCGLGVHGWGAEVRRCPGTCRSADTSRPRVRCPFKRRRPVPPLAGRPRAVVSGETKMAAAQ